MGESFVGYGIVAIRLILGGVLLAAAFFKLRHGDQAKDFIAKVGIPTRFVSVAYLSAVTAEALTGLFFIIGASSLTPVAGAFLFTVFIGALVRTRGSEQPCACLGNHQKPKSLLQTLVPRVAGLVACMFLLVVPEQASATPSLVSVALAGAPIAWIVRPRRSTTQVANVREGESQIEGRSPNGEGSRDDLRVDRRAALLRGGGLAAAGLVVPVNRLGNLLGFDCCYPPCPTGTKCYSSSTGQCTCMHPVVDRVQQLVGDPFPPPPPCDCQCQYEEPNCLEECQSGENCAQTECSVYCEKPGAECVVEFIMYLECIAACADAYDTCHANCMIKYYQCCASQGGCARGVNPRSVAILSQGRHIAERHGEWSGRAYLVNAIAGEAALVSRFVSMALSPHFSLLQPAKQRFVKTTLEERSDELLASVDTYRRDVADAFVMEGVKRNDSLGQAGLAISRGLDVGGLFSSAGTRRNQTRSASTNSRATKAKRSSTGKVGLPGRVRASIEQSGEVLRFAELLELPSNALPRLVAQGWRRDLNDVLQKIS